VPAPRARFFLLFSDRLCRKRIEVFSLIAAATLITELPGWFSPALAHATPSSAVACHFDIRAYLNIDKNGQGVAQVAGYVTDIPGSPTSYPMVRRAEHRVSYLSL